MKKTVALLLSLLIIGTFAACGKKSGKKVNVTIWNGSPALAAAEVLVSDEDGDGRITLSDALFAAHEENFNGGAEAGFGVEKTQFGLSLTKLWGVENGGAYGYCVNDAAALSLADEIEEGARVFAYAYQDTAAFSDTYAYFDTYFVEAPKGESVRLTVMVNTFDENWNTVTLPLANARITLDGEETDVFTDENGRAEISALENCVVSARCEDMVLAGPVCVVKVK